MFEFIRFQGVENFTCDKCRGRFQFTTAYSLAKNWGEFDDYYTYCFDCAKLIQKAENQPVKIDKRSLNKTGRTHQLGTRVRKDFLKRLKKIARKEKLKYVEVLERALDCYERNLLRKKAL